MRLSTLFLAAFILLFSTSFLSAVPTMKALIIVEDNYQDSSLNTISSSVKMDFSTVSRYLDVLDKKNVVKVEKTVLSGEDATSGNILTLLKNVAVTKDDILFVYFSGHGGMENGKTFLATAEDGTLYRADMEKLIQTKPARLKFLLTDACSSSIEGLGPRGLAGKKKGTETSDAFVEIYRNLFLNYQGFMDVAAASEGEYSWGGDKGGAFTSSMFIEVLMQKPKLSWEENFNEIRKKTQEKFNLMVNMGMVDDESLRDMKTSGIKSQTPKAYSLPSVIKPTASGNTQSAVQTTAQPSGKITADVKNNLDSPVELYVDNNTDEENWSWDNCVKYNFNKTESKKISGKNPMTLIIVLNNEKEEYDYYSIESTGKYTIDLDEDEIPTIFEE